MIIAGGFLGALGQGIRLIVGLKKLNEENSTKRLQGKETEDFSTSRLVLSIFIGFVAGALGLLIKGSTLGKDGNYSTESIVMIIAIGYSGADFIEGLFKTYISKSTSPNSNRISAAVSNDTSNNRNFPSNSDIGSSIEHLDESNISNKPPLTRPPNLK